MRFPLKTLNTLTVIATVIAGGAFVTQPVYGDIIDPPLPEALPNDTPLEDHTAQDGPMEDHTAQDGAEPGDPGEGDPPRFDKDKRPPLYMTPRVAPIDPIGPGADPFQIPIQDYLGGGKSHAPDLRDLAGGPASAQSLLDQMNHAAPSEFGRSGPIVVGTSAVPAPGVLIVIGLGGLALRRRRVR